MSAHGGAEAVLVSGLRTFVAGSVARSPRGREDDLRTAAEWLAIGRGSGFEDLLPSDRPVSALAAEVLAWLHWV